MEKLDDGRCLCSAQEGERAKVFTGFAEIEVAARRAVRVSVLWQTRLCMRRVVISRWCY